MGKIAENSLRLTLVERENRIAELEAALAPFARMSGSYTHMHGAHVIASRGGTILDVNDLRRAAALVPDAVV